MLSKNIMCSSKATVNTVLIVFGALIVFVLAIYSYVDVIVYLTELFSDWLSKNKVGDDKELLYIILISIPLLLGFVVWIGFPCSGLIETDTLIRHNSLCLNWSENDQKTCISSV